MKTSGKWKARRDESNLWGGVFCPKVNFVGVFGFIFYEKIKTNRLGTTCQLHVSPHPRAHNPTAINPMTERNHHQDNEESRRAKKKKKAKQQSEERDGGEARSRARARVGGRRPRRRRRAAAPAPRRARRLPRPLRRGPRRRRLRRLPRRIRSLSSFLAISSLFVDDLI